MKFIFLGSFNIAGGGYTTILEHIALGLVGRGHEVMILGLNYDLNIPHDYPFKLVPMEFNWSVEALKYIPDQWNADRVILAMDVPKLTSIAKKFIRDGEEAKLWRLEALYPIESHPILPEWIVTLGKFRSRFVISNYGVEQCKSVGLTATLLPMGCVVGTPPKSKEAPRKLLGWPLDGTIFFTVAANHERKSLPLAIEAFARMPEDTFYYILTDPYSKIGWNIAELLEEYGISDRCKVINMGVNEGLLSSMYWAADAFVLPSQAEGACLPVYEAAAHGLPVICGDHTGLSDVASEEWTMMMGYDHKYRYPWGNVTRWMISVDDLAGFMRDVHDREIDYDSMVEAAYSFAKSRSWDLAVDVIESGVMHGEDEEGN